MNLVDEEEKTLVTPAFAYEYSHIVEVMVNVGSEAISKGGQEISLTIACWKGQLKELAKIIQSGANFNLRDGVLRPLVAACYMGNLSAVKE